MLGHGEEKPGGHNCERPFTYRGHPQDPPPPPRAPRPPPPPRLLWRAALCTFFSKTSNGQALGGVSSCTASLSGVTRTKPPCHQCPKVTVHCHYSLSLWPDTCWASHVGHSKPKTAELGLLMPKGILLGRKPKWSSTCTTVDIPVYAAGTINILGVQLPTHVKLHAHVSQLGLLSTGEGARGPPRRAVRVSGHSPLGKASTLKLPSLKGRSSVIARFLDGESWRNRLPTKTARLQACHSKGTVDSDRQSSATISQDAEGRHSGEKVPTVPAGKLKQVNCKTPKRLPLTTMSVEHRGYTPTSVCMCTRAARKERPPVCTLVILGRRGC
ncbi:hypothetical protein TREES_T100012120 [Tupaia chinensis]|uniref:Uncharacterized protein n=1 Tax=Tupaia chinensis TaxID=246437 RepID=L9K0M4_TUPCH|nr:hypothetical protein TREES_T100012120 [Tupaia chinensis]